jgi:hypothetical protein
MHLDSGYCRKSVARIVLHASDPARERLGWTPDHINQIKLDSCRANLADQHDRAVQEPNAAHGSHLGVRGRAQSAWSQCSRCGLCLEAHTHVGALCSVRFLHCTIALARSRLTCRLSSLIWLM